MPTYKYIAIDKDGKRIEALHSAESEKNLVSTLRANQLTIVSITEQKKRAFIFKKSTKIKSNDLILFSRQLATMVNAGLPLVQGLDTLADQMENPSLKTLVRKLENDVEGGESFSQALLKHQKVFSEFYVSMVRAGEESGTLDEILNRLATYLENSAKLARKVKSAMVYPAVVTGMSILIVMVLILKVVPTFKNIFDAFGGTLPLPTRVLIGTSEILKDYFLIVAGILAVAFFLLRKYVQTEKGRLQFDGLKLRIIIFGALMKKVALAKFARTLCTLIKSSVPILKALEIVGATSGNKVLEKTLSSVGIGVKEGKSIAEPLSKSKFFPAMVVRMISVGEATGALEDMLTKIADFYESEVDAAVDGLTSVIEPVLICFLGIIIGGIVIAMFLPILKMSTLVTEGF
ncbi:MAG: type II secretion system F family protein [bacterium]|nr:type II secretion system F family protein [bacterium]